MQNDKKAVDFKRVPNYTIEQSLRLLKWTSRDLLMHINATGKTRIEKIAYSHWPNSNKKREEYLQQNYKPVSRITLYRIMTGKNKASEYTASLIREAIVNGMKREGIKGVSEEHIDIEEYKR